MEPKLTILRKDGKTPNPLLRTGEIRFMAAPLKYTPDGSYRLILPHEAEEFAKELRNCKLVACDTETTGLSWLRDHAIGMSFAVGTGPLAKFKGYYINDRDSFHWFKDFFMDTSIEKIFHNAKFDLHMLMNEDLIDVSAIEQTKIHDTMLMSYIANENERHGLKELAKKYIDPDADRLEKLLKEFMRANGCKTYEEVPLDLLTDYAAADTYYTLRLYERYIPILKEEKMMDCPVTTFLGEEQGSLIEIEELLMKELLFQERVGVQLDIPFIKNYAAELEVELPKLEQKILDIAGTINVRSTDELYQKLVQLGVHPSKFSLTEKEKKPQVNEDALELFLEIYSDNKELCEFITAVQGIKDCEKQLNTYLKAFIELADQNDRLHSNFNQHIARTGRLSSSDPNVQNIPKVYKKMRACFSVPKGWNLVFFDYSQIEMRLFADYSKDPIMQKAIWDGRDLHGETIRELMSMTVEKWDQMAATDDAEWTEDCGFTQEEWKAMYELYKELRQKGKTTNFSVVYGQGKKKTSDKLKLTKMVAIFQKKFNQEKQVWEEVKVGEEPDYSEGLRFLRRYYDKYPGVQTLMDQSKSVINARGFIRNRFNRRRRLEKKDSYKAVNALIQGCSADIIKVAMIRVGTYLRNAKVRAFLANNIHDEIWVYMPDEELYLIPIVKSLMETWTFPKFSVPIRSDVEISTTNWREKHHLSKDPRPEVQAIGEKIARGEY